MTTVSKILVSSVVKNEAAKFLPSAVQAWGAFADDIFILDDHSDDESVQIAKAKGAEVLRATASSLWNNETPLRQQLWNESLKRTKPGDWIFILDADMVPAKNPRELLNNDCDVVSFPLYDLWAEYSDGMLLYRTDGYWQAHNNYRPWLFKRTVSDVDWTNEGRTIHAGHFPPTLQRTKHAFAPRDYGLLHYAYLTQKLRQAKFKQYIDIANKLSPGEKAHAKSIMDTDTLLKPLEFTPTYTLKCES